MACRPCRAATDTKKTSVVIKATLMRTTGMVSEI